MQVSVLLPAYNAESTLAESVESVLAQTHREFELVVVDDGSTDGTRRIAEAFARRDRRVRVVSHEHVGMGESLNRAMRRVESDWIARIDADDLMLPARLERQIAFLRSNPGLAVASCLAYYINGRGRVIASSGADLLTPADLDRYLRTNRLIAVSHPGVIMNRQAVLSVGGYRPRFWPSDDIDLWNRLAEAGYAILVQPEYLIKYRIHAASICVARPWLTLRQIRWVEQSMLARRAGRPEPTLEEFLAMERAAPWLHRANVKRRELAQVLYKRATHYYGLRAYRRLAGTIAVSILLEPAFAAHRLWSKLVQHRLD